MSAPPNDQPEKSLPDPLRAVLDESHAALKPMSERSTMADTRQLAAILLRLIEVWRDGVAKTTIQPRHHV